MQKTGNGRLIVADGPRLLGVLSLKDLLHRLAVRSEFEHTR
jgi:predicted transcriptional regulator